MSPDNTSDLPELWSHVPHTHLRYRAGDKVADIDAEATPGFTGSKSDAPALMAERNERFAGLQEMLYANSRSGDHRSVLLVLQGMDTAGKGGIVKHVVGASNPQGIQYKSFGKPTPEELSHHYLWRINKALPAAGHIGVFDRSHYEDVLIVRVHNLVAPNVWGARYDEINAFEQDLVDAGTTIVKVAMFVSLAEQKKRLAERLDRPDKYWKYNPADIDERLKWPRYQEAYQAMLDKTSTAYAPWYIVPCNRKWYSRLAVLELMIEALKSLDLKWPPANFDVDAEKKRLAQA
ncbi:polyphosphate kinase 2 family protein [Mycolicibacterium diernhoferi]|uniref:PPK2 family polyphosphate--nucleotide phosphotransferase n=1 Tax=Mycolicibacterium diernhoferi TaxID=1801 RepID=A0A1Q4HCH7_9MYCO|nr:polyphosphate kinase 2 family protein [Mycolicibacterium diernhoferi]OJZ65246.1 PPK2 family polyphosphate--nucleotide phosphotransferase [Mycolicibacterium diernhoferi]OPE56393.1 PPK2 family polyphosphate--nucleotide phosphotransferase [Mycolicibacterium diernhoferi]PEG51151.1 PPK2 family polyphosphate--nucleotide phosphotransferase [Mycolicibacterium diernhoferi]QYL23534.1 polyphosphate kinase 2 family protein [Mycolicibacterium diernhoferi]